MSRSELAVLSCLRDSAQLSTLPAWCRGELSTAADLIDQLRQRLDKAEKSRDYARTLAADATTQLAETVNKLALAEQLLRVAVCPMAAQGCDGTQYPVGDPHGEYYGEQCQWCHERDAAIASQGE